MDHTPIPSSHQWVKRYIDKYFLNIFLIKASQKIKFNQHSTNTTNILANSANTKYRPFQVKINCSKFIIDKMQSRCDLTFLFSLFVASRNLLFGVFLPRENSRKYQSSVTERCTSLSKCSGMFRQNLLKVPSKNLNL